MRVDKLPSKGQVAGRDRASKVLVAFLIVDLLVDGN